MSDPFNEKIIKAYRNIRQKNITVIASLGRRDYHGILALNLSQRGRVICAGNSSSGIKEAGFFKCVAINIGDRQKSRLKSGVVIDCTVNAKEIENAIRKASGPSNGAFDLKNHANPYESEVKPSDIKNMIVTYAQDRHALIKRHLLSERQV